ncbi:hypothetical protein BDV11DRAFT_180796 [Aspergillus similis]
MLLNKSLHGHVHAHCDHVSTCSRLGTTMNTSVDYQTRRRLQNRAAQQRFREKSKKQIHSDAAQSDCYSSSALPKCSSEGQMSHIGGAATVETWEQTSLPLLTPSPLESHAVSKRLSDLEALPMEQYTPITPFGQATNSHDDGLCLYTPPLTGMCFDFEPIAPSEFDIGIPRTQEQLEEPEAGNRMSYTFSEKMKPLLDDPEDNIQVQLTDNKDNCSPENKTQGNDKAILVLQKQKVHLGRQAEELIRKLISVYELGVSLEIFPCDPYLKEVLETAETRFSSKWK